MLSDTTALSVLLPNKPLDIGKMTNNVPPGIDAPVGTVGEETVGALMPTVANTSLLPLPSPAGLFSNNEVAKEFVGPPKDNIVQSHAKESGVVLVEPLHPQATGHSDISVTIKELITVDTSAITPIKRTNPLLTPLHLITPR